jgi:tetratricopeptide (TPR) repeat protein
MRCFKRATQIDPGCVYAWTLCGYEAIEMEEYERAIAFYRIAIRTDGRHYNAWYVLSPPHHVSHVPPCVVLIVGTGWEWFMRKPENCVMQNIITVEQRI